MGGKLIDITGNKYGRLTVVKYSHMGNHGNSFWDCICDCGDVKKIGRGNLTSGQTKSCGCLLKEISVKLLTKHNLYGTPSYRIWNGMKNRCINKRDKHYKDYGERGITVCDKWLTFEGFYDDMGERPIGLTLDRKDNDKGYNKENCQWANSEQQQNNKRNNVNITYKNKSQTLSQWSRELGIRRSMLNSRLFVYNWSVEKTFETPKMGSD